MPKRWISECSYKSDDKKCTASFPGHTVYYPSCSWNCETDYRLSMCSTWNSTSEGDPPQIQSDRLFNWKVQTSETVADHGVLATYTDEIFSQIGSGCRCCVVEVYIATNHWTHVYDSEIHRIDSWNDMRLHYTLCGCFIQLFPPSTSSGSFVKTCTFISASWRHIDKLAAPIACFLSPGTDAGGPLSSGLCKILHQSHNANWFTSVNSTNMKHREIGLCLRNWQDYWCS